MLKLLIAKWYEEATQYEKGADECYDRGEDDNGDMNYVAATTLRQCAAELEKALEEK